MTEYDLKRIAALSFLGYAIVLENGHYYLADSEFQDFYRSEKLAEEVYGFTKFYTSIKDVLDYVDSVLARDIDKTLMELFDYYMEHYD